MLIYILLYYTLVSFVFPIKQFWKKLLFKNLRIRFIVNFNLINIGKGHTVLYTMNESYICVHALSFTVFHL